VNRARADQALNASVLDRLIGDGAGRSNGAPRLAELKRAVKRDLEMLLNSRARCLRPPADLTEIPHAGSTMPTRMTAPCVCASRR